ncbi:hypothetical protein MHY1_02450 [Methylovirgula sp. HY1]|nr:hypothetical protein MHY1_02450 [Methylovirgula sp. HY1]
MSFVHSGCGWVGQPGMLTRIYCGSRCTVMAGLRPSRRHCEPTGQACGLSDDRLLAMTTFTAAFRSCAQSAWMAGSSPAMTRTQQRLLRPKPLQPDLSFRLAAGGAPLRRAAVTARTFFRKRLPLSTYFAGLALAAYTDLLTFPSCVATKISVPDGVVSCHALLKAGSADFLADLRGTVFGDCVGRRQGAYQ